MTNPNQDQVESMARELATLRAQGDEAEALIRQLRARTIVLNNEIRHRDAEIAQLQASIATLVRDLAAAGPGARMLDDGDLSAEVVGR